MAERNYGTVRGPVDPKEARAGIFLKSFEMAEFKEMLAYCGQTKIAMVKNAVGGELVFTRINRWARGKKHDTWQVFLLSE